MDGLCVGFLKMSPRRWWPLDAAPVLADAGQGLEEMSSADLHSST